MHGREDVRKMIAWSYSEDEASTFLKVIPGKVGHLKSAYSLCSEVL